MSVAVELIQRRIFFVRNQKVMLDSDLAQLYGVTTSNLNKAVKRNIDRFPRDFIFQLVDAEVDNLRFQIGISSPAGRGGRRYAPHAFTEQGVAMLSSVLRSERAVLVNVAIMRAFVKIREMMAPNKEIAQKLDALEKKYDARFRAVFGAIRRLMSQPGSQPRRQIGFAPSAKLTSRA